MVNFFYSNITEKWMHAENHFFCKAIVNAEVQYTKVASHEVIINEYKYQVHIQ